MNCYNCGQMNPDGSASCSACGANLAQGMPAPPRPYGTPPPNHLVWAILATLFCCLPGGIVAIVFAARVDSKFMAGDYAGAQKDSDTAKLWCWISAGTMLAIAAAYLLLVFFAVFAGAAGNM